MESPEYYRRLFTYSPEEGHLIHRPRSSDQIRDPRILKTWNTRYAGMVAGMRKVFSRRGVPHTIYVQVGERQECAHRIIWVMVNGSIPDGLVIDHKNCDPWDNRLDNLRLATPFENARNTRTPITNTNGVKGVFFIERTGKWVAHITVDNKRMSLGCFQTKGLAAVARAKAAIRYHGKFARLT